MLYGIQIRAHGWPRNISHGFALEVGFTALERWGLALSSIYRGLVASEWLSIWGTTTGCRRLWCTYYQLGCLAWWLNPASSRERYSSKPLLRLHRNGQLAGCSLYVCVSKPSSGHRLHEAETGCGLTNGSCAMSLNSNHVVLNTMPNVIVDVGPPTVDV
jgi:hypothetical protein